MPRRLAWAFSNVVQPLTDGLRVTSNLLLDAPASDTITVARVIVRLTATPELGSFLVGVQSVRVGIGVAFVEAFGVANSGGIPNPANSAQSPPRGWLYSDVLDVYQDEGQTNADFRYFIPSVHMDLRAARKVDRGVCFLTMTNTNIFGVGQTINVSGRIAVLCMT